jgi:tRNA 2-selenouridine synthase
MISNEQTNIFANNTCITLVPCNNTCGLSKSDIKKLERIKKRFGPNETKMTLQFLQEGEVEQAFRILLNYYDKMYEKSLFNRENIALLLHKKTFDTLNSEVIAQSIIST